MGEDCKQDAIHARPIRKSAHRPGSPSYLSETSFNRIRGSKLSPRERCGNRKKCKELRQIPGQAGHRLWIDCFPLLYKTLGSLSGLLEILGMTDPMQCGFHPAQVLLPHMVEHIAGLMGPAPLDRDLAVDQGKGGLQTLASIRYNQLQCIPLQPPLVQVV